MTNRLCIPKNAEWTPKYFSQPRGSKTLGPEVKAFAESFLVAQRGFAAGKPIVLTQWQTWLINNLFELDAFGFLRYKTVVVMIPRKNGKTFIMSIIVIFTLLTSPTGAEIYSAAKNRTQARLVYDLVVFWIERNPYLSQILKIKQSQNRIYNTSSGSFYEALSADSGSVHGRAPSTVIADEIHAWESEHTSVRAQEFWNGLTKGSADRPESQIIAISTAGNNMNDSLLGSLYKRGIDAVSNPEADSSKAFGFFCWEANEEDSPLEVSTWKKANPNLAEGLLNISTIEEALASSAAVNMATFLRDHLNIWSRIAGEPFMPAFHWGNAYKDLNIPLGARVTVGFDAAKRGDCAGIVIIDYETGVMKVHKVWEKPLDANDEWYIDRDEVMESLKEVYENYDVIDLWADHFYYESDIKKWKQQYKWKVTDIPQSASRIQILASEFLRDVIENNIFQPGNEALTRHVGNALANETKGYSKEHRRSRSKIDLLACAVMANGARNFHKGRDARPKHKVIYF